jgi:hypothetical protein
LRSGSLREIAAFLLACLIGAGAVSYHHLTHFDPHVVWDGFNLPGFDAHVYVAMAEEPRTFTVGPWGYRILLPSLLGTLLPPRLIVPGFEWAARVSLVLASGLLLVYLRVLGATLRSALLAVLVAMFTPPVGAVFDNPFLVEPFALALLLAVLIAIESAANVWIVALALLLVSLSKEIWVLLLPLVFLKAFPQGAAAAGLRTLRVAGPAIGAGVALRWMWPPSAGRALTGADVSAALNSIASNVPVFAPEFLLGGLSVVVGISLARPSARRYLRAHALTLAPLLALPLVAAAYTGEGAATSFFAGDVRRLLIYALPFLAALAVCLDPGNEGRKELPKAPSLHVVAMALALVVMLAPLALDRYSRLDLNPARDGPYLLGFVRESLRTAGRLDRGNTVVLDPNKRKFAWGVSPPSELEKLRFFLGRGFGPLAHYGIHDIRMRESTATLVVPVLQPRQLAMVLTMDARESVWTAVFAAGERVGEALVGPQAVQVTFEIPGAKLFRGDNEIQLRCAKAGTALPRILRLELTQAKP